MSTLDAITPDLYRKWRFARRGKKNAERMNNAVWKHLIETEDWPGRLSKTFRPDETFPEKPRWCFSRMGMTTTELPDGRTVHIAGEHEDYYDPDFYIYNDIVVEHADGRLEILGFPKETFPPTDFHTATLIDGLIWVVGTIGYSDERRYGFTQVLTIDPQNWTIALQSTTGENPGWIAHHVCELEDATLVISDGKIITETTTLNNLDTYRLDTKTKAWSCERSTAVQFLIERTDGKRSLLWEFGQLAWNQRASFQSVVDYEQNLTESIGVRPNMELFANLYDICGAVRQPEEDDEIFNLVTLDIDGSKVSLFEEGYGVRVIFEQEEQMAEEFVAGVADNLTLLEQTDYQWSRL